LVKRPEERYDVDFPVLLSWQTANGLLHRVTGRCVDLSPSGAKLKTIDRLETGTGVLVHSEQFGRMGRASVRYCVRAGMKYDVGLLFADAFLLSTPARRKILDRCLACGGYSTKASADGPD
jgi:hypothetical protein